jgi:hypothetical protein
MRCSHSSVQSQPIYRGVLNGSRANFVLKFQQHKSSRFCSEWARQRQDSRCRQSALTNEATSLHLHSRRIVLPCPTRPSKFPFQNSAGYVRQESRRRRESWRPDSALVGDVHRQQRKLPVHPHRDQPASQDVGPDDVQRLNQDTQPRQRRLHHELAVIAVEYAVDSDCLRRGFAPEAKRKWIVGGFVYDHVVTFAVDWRFRMSALRHIKTAQLRGPDASARCGGR